MLVAAECIPCYLKQAISAMIFAGLDKEQQYDLVAGLLPHIVLEKQATPNENSSLLLHEAVKLIGKGDPFKEAKEESNRRALALLPALQQQIAQAPDPLLTALQVAVAGNVVDFGITHNYSLENSLQETLGVEFSQSIYSEFQHRLAGAELVLIIGDNSGEIAFDIPVVDELNRRGIKVIYAVKAGPILNDATRADATMVGMDQRAMVIDNGNNFLGTVFKHCSEEFLETMIQADLILSKGQANYESLEGTPEAGQKTFFLLKAKCEMVARYIGVELGEIVFTQNKI